MECDSSNVIAILCARHADMDAIRRQIGLRHGSSPVSYGVDISDLEQSARCAWRLRCSVTFVRRPLTISVFMNPWATVWNGMYRWQAISGYVVEG